MLTPKNCWEIKKCGLEPGGENVRLYGVCPAAICNDYEGINRGQNAGRFCWAVAGTQCGGKVQGIFAMKIESCMHCEVFQAVSEEEGSGFTMHPEDCNRDTSDCSAAD